MFAYSISVLYSSVYLDTCMCEVISTSEILFIQEYFKEAHLNRVTS